MTSVLVIVLIVLALVIINGLFVAAEFALVGSSKSLVAALAEGGHPGAVRAKPILEEPRAQDRYIATTQLGVQFASLGLGMYGERTIADRLTPLFADWGAMGEVSAHAVASLAAIGFLSYLHVVFGEMVPKSIALARPTATLFLTVPIALGLRAFLLPLVVSLEWASNRVLRLIGIDRSKLADSAHHTEEDLVHIVQDSLAGGELRDEAGRALGELFDFSSLKAYDVMVPRVAMHGIRLGATPDDIKDVLKDGQHTRYPVYEEDLDEIVGMVHIRDLLQLLGTWEPLERSRVRSITFVPETMTLDRILGAMRRDRTHAVIVMDEQGGTAGMLTVKDLFEEVVGTIEEGHELEGRVEAFRDEKGRLHVHGTLRVVELAEVLEITLPPIDAETVSGLVLLQLGRPARVGDTVRHGPIQLIVIAIEGRGVKECLVQLSGPLRR